MLPSAGRQRRPTDTAVSEGLNICNETQKNKNHQAAAEKLFRPFLLSAGQFVTTEMLSEALLCLYEGTCVSVSSAFNVFYMNILYKIIYKYKNRIGPRMDPWGTPLVISGNQIPFSL